jgi:hypothetical protein
VIGPAQLETALSQHLARTVVNTQTGANAMAVDGVDQGVDLQYAAALGYRYFLYLTGPAPMAAGDAAAAAFAAGVIVGRTAREEES